jgi:hypothetical protein
VSATDTARWLRASRRAFLLRDFYTFAKHSGICPDIDEDPYREICDFLESLIPKPLERGSEPTQTLAMFLTPRLTYKTSLIKALTPYAHLKYMDAHMDLRMVLGRATLGMAKQTLAGVREALVLYPDLRDIFGDLVTQADSWTTTEVRFSNRFRAFSEPSIDTVGLDTSRTGAHPDFAILDDLVHENNFESKTEMEKACTLVQAYYAILERNGTLLLTGTRWGDNDVYGWVLDAERARIEAGKPPRWKTFIRGAWKPDGELAFPAVLSRARLADLQERTTPKLFSAWYLNEPRAEGERIFPPSAIRLFDADFYPGPMPQLVPRDAPPALAAYGTRIPLYVVMTVDPAPTVGPKSDFTGIVVTGFGPQGLMCALHADQIKMLPHDRLSHLLYLCMTYEPHILAIENADIDAPLLQERLDAARLHTKVMGFNPKTDRRKMLASALAPRGHTSKASQIEALHSYLPDMWFLRGQTSALVEQMLAYPYLNHDDVIDAFSIAPAFRRDIDEPGQDLESLFWRNDEEQERREYDREAYPEQTKERGRSLVRGGPYAPTYR